MRTGAKLSSIVLTGLMFVAVAAASVVAHGEPEPAPVDPNLRTLALISLPQHHHDRPNATSSSSNTRPEGQLGLSLRPNETASPSRQYQTQSGSVICIGYCGSTQVVSEKGISLHHNDFEISRDESYSGQIHFSYNWMSQTPTTLYSSGIVGYVTVQMLLGAEDYGTTMVPLNRRGGDVVQPLEFHHSADCHGSQEQHNHTACQAGDNETLPTYNATMVSLHITISTYRDTLSDPLGGTLSLKLDTAGGSWLQVREIPPPAVEILAVEANSVEAEEIPVTANDTNGDGEIQIDEVEFVPSASPALVLAVLGGLGVAVRRLRR